MKFSATDLIESTTKKIALAEAKLVTLRESVLRETEVLKALPSELPAEIQDIRIEDAKLYAPVTLTFKATSRQQVLELFKELGSLPLLMFSGGVTRFTPEVLAPEGSADGKPIGPLVYRVSTWVKNAQEEYFWWTYVGNHLTEIRAVSDPAIEAKVTPAHTYNNSQHSANLHWSYENLPRGMHTFWYGGSVSHMTPVTVHLSRDTDVFEAYAQSMSLQYRQANVAACSC